MSVGAVIVAAGSGRRLGGEPKQFRQLGMAPLLAWSCHAMARHEAISELVVVVPAEFAAAPPDWLPALCDGIVEGGPTRRDSVGLGLAGLAGEHETVLVHDGARPFLPAKLIDRVLAAALEGPAIPGLPLTDTVKLVGEGGLVLSTLDRERLQAVQTPQGFPLALLRSCMSGRPMNDPRRRTTHFSPKRSGFRCGSSRAKR
jgi:2-C-methyl-D-erythritol 4-phosphate cytidylyltransferase/2-C-methyl-D-erythritol 2,4-cyclodiphosphate synthase